MTTRHFSLTFGFVLILLLTFSGQHATAQNIRLSGDKVPPDALQLDRLVDSLDKKIAARSVIRQTITSGARISADTQRTLDDLNDDIQTMSETFELLTVGDFDESLFSNAEDTPFDWRVELMLVLEPLIDSLQSLTEKPRQMTNLRNNISLNRKRLEVSEAAINRLSGLPITNYEDDTKSQLVQLQEKWLDQKESYEQRLLSAEAQLDRLIRLDASAENGLIPSMRTFMLGRGLTLILTVLAALFAWFLMRFIWWFFSTRLITKEQRRSSLWFRLLSYSFYLVNIIICIIAILVVLYVREDLMLLALTLLALVVTVLGIRRYIPSYIREARLLLDLGSVREGERVMYNDLPWQVMSVNLHTVLWNPALEGISRLPLEAIESLHSRPVKDKHWFPTNKGDYVILPDTTFGEVLSQTPELVQLRIRGGMIQTIRTADFYAMNITNLSAGKTYGVAVTFGFDYNLQSISLTDIPDTLKSAIEKAFKDQGFKGAIESLLVELKAASSSSIDYLVYASVKSEKAGDYFRVERIIQQTCVAVANEKRWNIPFPQMMIHYNSNSAETT